MTERMFAHDFEVYEQNLVRYEQETINIARELQGRSGIQYSEYRVWRSYPSRRGFVFSPSFGRIYLTDMACWATRPCDPICTSWEISTGVALRALCRNDFSPIEKAGLILNEGWHKDGAIPGVIS